MEDGGRWSNLNYSCAFDIDVPREYNFSSLCQIYRECARTSHLLLHLDIIIFKRYGSLEVSGIRVPLGTVTRPTVDSAGD